ncbi:MAG TPA: hypothetical protein VE978_12230 [Chitinophagales bacterium]|nr:hypothetical protein [Chitinophagales bacterium]
MKLNSLLKRFAFFPVLLLFSQFVAQAQENENPLDTLTRTVNGMRSELDALKRIKVTGYIQGQFQVIDSAGARSFAGGDFASGVDKRFMVRRGRIKFTYDAPLNAKGWSTSQYLLQFDVTEKGLTIKDAWARLTDPWSGWFSLTAGMQNRPFGYEIVMSSSVRESPERGRLSQIIFPNERDLGMMLTLQGPKNSNWNWLKIDAGFFNGTGAPSVGINASDFDKFKDFIGHIGISRTAMEEKIRWGLGASYYSGGFRHDVSDSYKFGTDAEGSKGFEIVVPKADVDADINKRLKIERTHVGADAQFSISWLAGITTLRGEYIQGTQPGTSGSSASPVAAPTGTATTYTSVTTIDSLTGTATTTTTASTSTSASDLYSRKFNGAYFYFVQSIAQTPWQAIVKYDWYDPNTDVADDEIGKKVTAPLKATNGTDIKYTTLGLGLAYRWDANIKITAYYDIVKNETSTNLAGFTADIPDNVFTLRVQVKF